MMAFLVAAGTLSLLTVSIVLLPWRRNGGARPLALAVAIAVVGGACALYAGLGTPSGLAAAPADPAHLSARDAQAIVNRLASHMRSDPGNVQGWLLLARGQALLNHYDEAAAAYAQLVALGKGDADVLADYAEVLAQLKGNSLAGKPEDLLVRALSLDPKHPRALYLAGGAQFERGEYQKAIDAWQQLASVTSDVEELHGLANANIAVARARIGAAPK